MSLPEREETRRAIRRTVAERPGVYRLLGRAGETIYIGKSVNLRDRLLSYFGSRGAGPLEHGIHGFETRETRTELLALLLEDALIKRELPRHNVRQAELADFRYLILTDDPYPACRAVEEPPADALEVFGPLRGEYFAAEIRDIVTRTLGLRSCEDRRPFRRSANHDLGYCSGPCRGAISEASYGEIVERVIAFLRGDDGYVTPRLEEDIVRRAEALDYERCAELRRLLERCRRFCARQRFIERFRGGALPLFDRGDGLRYDFAGGALIAVRALAETPCSSTTFPQELAEPVADPRALLDRAGIVQGWVARHATTCRVDAQPSC